MVVLTSAEFEDSSGINVSCIHSARVIVSDTLHCYALIRGDSASTATIARVIVPKIPGYFTGTGDATTALLLGYIYRTRENVAESLQLAISAVQVSLLVYSTNYKLFLHRE